MNGVDVARRKGVKPFPTANRPTLFSRTDFLSGRESQGVGILGVRLWPCVDGRDGRDGRARTGVFRCNTGMVGEATPVPIGIKLRDPRGKARLWPRADGRDGWARTGVLRCNTGVIGVETPCPYEIPTLERARPVPTTPSVSLRLVR